MAKSQKPSASTWRRLDAAFRADQKKRRNANKARRQARLDAETAEIEEFDTAPS